MDYFVSNRKDFEFALSAAQKGDVVTCRNVDFNEDDELSIVTSAEVVMEGCRFWRSPQQNYRHMGVKDNARLVSAVGE